MTTFFIKVMTAGLECVCRETETERHSFSRHYPFVHFTYSNGVSMTESIAPFVLFLIWFTFFVQRYNLDFCRKGSYSNWRLCLTIDNIDSIKILTDSLIHCENDSHSTMVMSIVIEINYYRERLIFTPTQNHQIVEKTRFLTLFRLPVINIPTLHVLIGVLTVKPYLWILKIQNPG